MLRPNPGAGATVAKALAAGFEARAYPLFEAVALPWAGPEPHLVDAVMFTSANGARLGGAQLGQYTHLPSFAVGEATAEAVREAGFASPQIGETDVQSLVHRIAADGYRNVLHIAGRDVRAFDPEGLNIISACAYAALEQGDAEGLSGVLPPGMILLVHSPRAGARLAELVLPEHRGHLHLVAISSAALAVCGSGWATACAAEKPRDDAMLALAAGLCE
ncbi:MAG: uroporphyrinogen-III synthase [Sphingobium sp.]|uniref:uroporphyrinogen-III synthase n=1 Tax=Sphingobium sp. TaxID=1912891 RepID=UPI0029A968D0|nr:uroporphyrinogen-III synthase [Sphingobium sp.]MDX3910867.1 uroporphyrinogen-III synthase [Sphingobium sp.]